MTARGASCLPAASKLHGHGYHLTHTVTHEHHLTHTVTSPATQLVGLTVVTSII